MRALFLTKYSYLGASSRYRALQYIPALEARGWQIHVQPLLSDQYLSQLYGQGRRPGLLVARALWRRMRDLRSDAFGRFDAVYIQYELLPLLPFFCEARFYKANPRTLVDYDDAMFLNYQHLPLLRAKIPEVIRASKEVLVGNEYLRSYAAQYHPRVTTLPTVIDCSRYRVKTGYEIGRRPVVLGWIGTPMTMGHLRTCSGALAILAKKYPLVLRCVGTTPDFAMEGVQVENLAWEERTETEVLRSFDIGLMPLPNDAFTIGKCGFKLIQYMGCAVPCVGAARGANMQILQDGENGYLAGSAEDYVEKIGRLIESPELRGRLGKNGRQTVVERYSLQATAGAFCDLLSRTAGLAPARQRQCTAGRVEDRS